jgi:hypothetical protein
MEQWENEYGKRAELQAARHEEKLRYKSNPTQMKKTTIIVTRIDFSI